MECGAVIDIEDLSVSGIAGAGNERPEIPYLDRGTAGVFQLAEEMIGLRIEDIDRPIAEISDKEIVGELAKAGGRDRKSPGRIERSARCDPVQQVPVQVELIHETIASTGDVIVFGVILQCERDEQVAVKNLNVERRKAGRQVMIGKAFHLLEVVVEDVDGAIAEVCRVKQGAMVSLRNRETLVDGSGTALRVIDSQDGAGDVHARIPAGNGAVLGCEKED